jgi:hypothetical protein
MSTVFHILLTVIHGNHYKYGYQVTEELRIKKLSINRQDSDLDIQSGPESVGVA